jgi:membrane protease YdiL (CAAX protease family)
MQPEPAPETEPTTRGAGAGTTTGADAGEPGPPPAGPENEAVLRRMRPEILLVLGLSLGQSAVYSVVSLIGKLTAGKSLADQTATLNASQSSRAWLDLTYQILDIGFTLVPVLLAIWLLAADHPRVGRLLGLDRRHPWRDLAQGAGLAALIGLPGLALYFIGHAVGITATIVPDALNEHWWTVPILILQAIKNAALEEVIVVGYLITRLRQLGWPTRWVIATSAVLRGSYHLYQGIGPFFGNAVMGVIFGYWFRRGGRVTPLIIAHSLLDIVAFVGYDLFGGLLGLKH